MVTTVFQFGSYPTDLKPEQVPLWGDSLSGQYTLNQALVYTAILLILVMLCTKPCMVKLSGTKHVHEEIEFQAVNQMEENQIRDVSAPKQGPSINAVESVSRDMSSDEMMMKR